MSRSIPQKFTVGFAIALIAVIVNALISYRNTIQLVQNEERVAHTLQVLAELESTLSTLKDAETGQRGYILTGDEAYLQPYQAAITSIDERIASLKQLTADNPGQQRSLVALEQQSINRLDRLQQTITLRRTQGLEAARQSVLSGQGKQIMDEIRQLIVEMAETEEALLEQRVSESQISIQRTTVAFTLASLFGMGLLSFLYFLIRHDFAARQQAQAALQQSAQEFEALYNDAPCGYHSLDRMGNFVCINDTELRMLGYTREEIIGKRQFADLLTDESVQVFQHNFPLFKQRGWVNNLQFQMIRKDGSILPVTLNAVAVKDAAGNFLMSRSTVLDDTERQQAEALLKQTKNDLEVRVAERTVELLQANQQLQQELDDRKRIQSALEVSQARFAGILEIASDAIVSVDANQIITLFNQGAERVFGYRAEEVIGQPLDLLLPKRSVAAHRQHVGNFAQSDGRARRMGERSEIFARRQDGSEFPAEASISRLKLDNDTIFTAILRDVSDRKQAEESLRLSEERLQLALEGADDGLWDWNISTGECYFSPGWLRMLDYAPGELPENVNIWEQLIHPDDKDWVLNCLDAHLQDSSVPYKFDYRVATKSGAWKWIANYGKVTKRGENGSPLRMTGTHRDVSDRKQTELNLSRLAAIVESSEDAIVSKTLDGTITSWNASAERLYGYTAEEAIGQPITLIIPPTHLSEQQQSLQSIQQGEPIHTHETVRQRKDGTLMDVALTLSPVRDATGKLVGISSIARDITDRKQIDRMKSEFVSVVSHELRTPLTSIHGSLGMLASGLLKPDSEQGKRMLQIAVDSTDRLVRLINDILDIERIESGRVKMEKEYCQIDDLITEVVNVVQTLADKAGVILSVTSLSTQIWVDLDRIVQTLTNLLSNAIKFSPSGNTVWLTVQQQSNHVLFTVKDQGRGIPVDKLDSIFERFQQVDSSDSRNHEGTGLGLAICRSIVQQHGGQIWVESILGEGSTFFFTVPVPDWCCRKRMGSQW